MTSVWCASPVVTFTCKPCVLRTKAWAFRDRCTFDLLDVPGADRVMLAAVPAVLGGEADDAGAPVAAGRAGQPHDDVPRVGQPQPLLRDLPVVVALLEAEHLVGPVERPEVRHRDGAVADPRVRLQFGQVGVEGDGAIARADPQIGGLAALRRRRPVLEVDLDRPAGGLTEPLSRAEAFFTSVAGSVRTSSGRWPC